MVEIRLFGEIGAVDDDGRPIDVGPARCKALLAALALSAGAPVPVPRLVESIWGERPPRTAEKTLQTYVARLRKALGSASIARVGAAYRLDLDPSAVDVVRFERRLDAGDVDGALAEWGGEPMAGLDVDGPLRVAAEALVERWLGAVEERLGRAVEADPASAVGSLTELTAAHPFREGFWALLMSALYRSGRQADALAAFQSARSRLVDELGVEPGPRLRELEAAILAHDVPVPDSRPAHAEHVPVGGVVTFGATDVEGATRLWALHGAEAARALTRLDDTIREAAERHAGRVVASGGDALTVVFRRPTDAAAWAQSVQAAAKESWMPGAVAPRLRVGLHTGEAEAHGRGYFGPAVNTAAALAAAGHGGQTLVSGATAALLPGGELIDVGAVRPDELAEEIPVLQLGVGTHPPVRGATERRGNLPRRLGTLHGRDAEIALVADAIATAPIVTLVGPGGIGKTRLALAAARRAEVDLAHGAWLVELAEVASPDEVARATAEVLGVPGNPSRPLADCLVAALRPRHALVVLDNCEHVVDGAATLAAALADGAPNVRVLATSREPLAVREERVLTVAPLDAAGAATDLFAERARAADPEFDLERVRPDVEEICRRLDGVPLAIELAAARARVLAPHEIAARLDERLRLLTGGRRTDAGRHRTLRATVQWSYDLLPPGERTLFDRLAVFAGSFDLRAAETVAADSELGVLDVDDHLGALVDRSMLMVESGPFGRRFRMLETMRSFGAERLDATGDPTEVERRHSEWCRSELAAIRARLLGPEEVEGVARLDELWPNLRAAVDRALERGDHLLAVALVRPIVAEVLLRSRQEIGDWLERILSATPPEDEKTIVFCLSWAAQRLAVARDRSAWERLAAAHGSPADTLAHHARVFVQDDFEGLLEWAPRASAALRAAGDDHGAELAEIDVGAALLNLGRLAEHDEFVGALAERYRLQGPPTLRNWTLMLLGYSARFQGRSDEAERRFADAVALRLPPRTHSPSRTIEARDAFRQGDVERALAIFGAHVEDLAATDNMQGVSITCVELADVLANLGRLEEAARMLGYLEASGMLATPAFLALVADAERRVADGAGTVVAARAEGHLLDDRGALEWMRAVLDRLLAERRASAMSGVLPTP